MALHRLASFTMGVPDVPGPSAPTTAPTATCGPEAAPPASCAKARPPQGVCHVVLGTTDLAVTLGFFRDGLGLKAGDHIKDAAAFLRCSTDHHKVLIMNAPVTFLHHSSWQVDDIDEVLEGARGLFNWGPPPPPSFLHPDGLAALMTGSHSA
ncbi:VOC family protein [Thermomonospora umbrina]|uniref:VOC family protein n=1 Tax=Thermomonospora umbrina TaxID=111806 RepID=UPI001FE49966|nr:VOC family protein [Thermomonospora umbrina]